MDPAEEDWASRDEGANQISHGGTFSNFALALPPRRSSTYANASQLAEQAKRELAARSIAGGAADGASLRAPGVFTAMSSRSDRGGAASGAGEDQDKTSAVKGDAKGRGRAQVHHSLMQHGARW